MSRFEESNFYKTLQDFFINNNKDTFLEMLSEFYNRTEGIIDKNKIQDDLIKELRELYLEFNEKGIDENIVREKVNYFLENSLKIKDINSKLNTNTNNIENINSQLDKNVHELDNKKMDKDTLLSIHQIDKNKGKIDETYLSDKLLAQMSGNTPISTTLADKSITNSKFAEKSITPSLLRNVTTGKNLFEGIYTYGLGLSGASADDFFVKEIDNSVSAIIKIKNNTDYTITRTNDCNRFRIATFINYPNVGDTCDGVGGYKDGVTSYTFNSGDCNYLFVYLSNQNLSPQNLQLEKGTVSTEFEDVKYNIPLAEKSVKISNLKNINPMGIVIGYNPIVVDFINNMFTIKKDGHQIVINDKMYTPSSAQTLNFPSTNGCILLFNTSTCLYEVYSPSECVKNLTDEKVFIGTVRKDLKTSYLNGLYLDKKEEQETKSEYKKKIISKEVNSNFINGSEYIDVGLFYNRNQLNDLYNEWDKLVEKSNGYVTKTLLGNDATGLPIYRYDFKPYLPQENIMNVSFPKILYLGGIHGHERFCNVYDLRFFKELVENWQNNDVLEMLRFNVHFIVVPVQCPWGYDNFSRVNSNGVNINRNHSIGWSLTEEGENYSGAEPMSEIETQIIDKLLNDNKDALFVLDHHNCSSFTTDGYVAWFGSRLEKTHEILFGLCNYMDGYTKKKHEWLLTENENNKFKNLYCLKSCTNGGLATTFNEKYGLNGMILETIPSWGNDYTADKTVSQSLIIDLIGNLLLTVLKNSDYLLN